MPPAQDQVDTEAASRSPGSRRWIGLGVGAIAGLLSIWIVFTAVAVRTSPSACDPCHQSAVDALRDGSASHGSVRCTECHPGLTEAGGIAGVAHILEGTLRNRAASGSTVGRVPDDACSSCHPPTSLLRTTSSGGINMSHKGLAQANYACSECHAKLHGSTLSGRLAVPTMGTCLSCHNGKSASNACGVCHSDQLADEEQLGDAEFAVTHGPQWKKNHGLGDLRVCGTCHTPQKCEGCHGVPFPHPDGFGAEHGRQAVQRGKKTCYGCHAPSFCTSCHAMPMPHPTDFLARHPSVAASDTDPRCMGCHTTENCGQCHVRHAHPGSLHRYRRPFNKFWTDR